MVISKNAYTSGHFLFLLDGHSETNWLKSVDGGTVKSEVLAEDVGPDTLTLKHVATVSIDPITVEVGMASTGAIFKWIQDSWNRKFARNNGSIVHANFNREAQLEQWFRDALISEVTFPALDGGDDSPAYLSVKLQPEYMELRKGDGTKVQGKEGTGKQKRWTPSSFRLDLDGIDCSRVNKIDSFTIKQKIKPLYIGSSRFPELEPMGVEFPNLTLTVATAFADDFIQWHHEFVVKGGRTPDLQKTGTIEFLDPSGDDTPIFSIDLDQVGINQITVEKSDAGANAIKRCKIELFVQQMKLVLNSDGLE